jgi:FlaA1/EpsC-like NDP-sugar epimerase
VEKTVVGIGGWRDARRALLASADCSAWVAGIGGLALYHSAAPGDVVALAVVATAAQAGSGVATALYRGRYLFGSFDEVWGVIATWFVTLGVTVAVVVVSPLEETHDVLLTGSVAALLLMAGLRYSGRAAIEWRRQRGATTKERLLVYGADPAAAEVVRAMLLDCASPYLPVALLDDDPTLRRRRIMGISVVGSRSDMAVAATKYRVDTLLVGRPNAPASLLRDLKGSAAAAGLRVKVVQAIADLGDEGVGIGHIRELKPSDLLGRHAVQTDVASIAGYLTGKRVLVTGAGGSIGAELCRAIWPYKPAELMMLDRDESALHAVQLSLYGRALLDSDDVILSDIRDGDHLQRVFQARRPQVVFHAAALKHLPMLEQYPGEAIKTNVWGTLAVLQAAVACGVERFVNISTDKAADPSSVLGYSKRIGERLTAAVVTGTGDYLSVRFGNVLGSRGSVLISFTAQAARGGPLTVTDPDVTRYFMTVQEAVELVIQAGAIGSHGQVLVLDMGRPVRIADVAHRIAADAGVGVIYTGLRPGEKLHEVLFGVGECDVRPQHPLISHVAVPPIDPDIALALDPHAARLEIVEDLRTLCVPVPLAHAAEVDQHDGDQGYALGVLGVLGAVLDVPRAPETAW